jgi:SAM-dependent methyltransferase
MVTLARRNYPAIPFREADAECLPHPDASFDAVACAFGLMHMEHPDKAISEAFRVLRSGGVFSFTQWATDDELLGIVGTAVATHGSPAVAMPPAPPLMRFANPDECQRALLAQGFTDPLVKRLELVWQCTNPEAVLDLIHGGAVRAAMLINAQSPGDHERVQAAIVEAVRSRRTPEGRYLLRRPAVLAQGRKPKG